ncbi:hypothetical protein MAR_012674 [Mya arenaria]|uniref:Uncharacterized protein n=1 Tax=Mya arenaria TaxID=6604 RepID=A0ABY7FYA8_MYAAR|nr:hypothetical protein MAR_012674 [Mya arenaria]
MAVIQTDIMSLKGIDRILGDRKPSSSSTPPPAHQSISGTQDDVTNETRDSRVIEVKGLELPEGWTSEPLYRRAT